MPVILYKIFLLAAVLLFSSCLNQTIDVHSAGGARKISCKSSRADYVDAGIALDPNAVSCGSGASIIGFLQPNIDADKVCTTTVNGIALGYVLPESGEPKRIGLYFHGDGGGSATRISSSASLDFAYKNDILYMQPLSPVIGSNAKEQWSDHEMPDNVSKMIHTFAKKYNISTGNVLFSSASGGSHYLTNEFISKAGDDVQGTFALGCGGSEPEGDRFEWDTSNTAVKKRFCIHYYYTTIDRSSARSPRTLSELQAGGDEFLRNAILDSYEFYRDEGFPVSLDHDASVAAGHCGGDVNGFIRDTWSANHAK